MDDAGVVDGGEGVSDFSRVVQGSVVGECAACLKDGLGEGCSFDQVHDEVGGAVFVRDDVAN